MDNHSEHPRLVFPKLAGFYGHAIPLSWLVVRLAAGSTLLMHAWPKLMRGPSSFSGVYEQLGLHPGAAYAWLSTTVELLAGLSLVLGLFTRFFAAAAAVEMAVILVIYLPNGYSWLGRGYEFVLMWGLLCFAIALRGGGPYSLDRRLGVQL